MNQNIEKSAILKLTKLFSLRVVLTAAAYLLLITAVAHSIKAQSALDGFDPNANGTIRAIVVQPDGKILIGGTFTTILGTARNRIARLNPDGTLDPTFDPNADSTVFSIHVQSDGKVLLGGIFTQLAPNGGAAVTRNRIARVNADGTLDTTFDPNASSDVRSITVQSDGKILLGGFFTTLSPNGGAAVTRNSIARVNTDGTLDATFDPNANGMVYSIHVQPDGKVLLGGSFNTLTPNGGAAVARLGIARVNADGTFDTTFNASTNNVVYSIHVQPDGKILLGGVFNTLTPNGGATITRNRIARVNADGTLDATFDPNADGTVFSIAIQSDGKILLGGIFTQLAPNGGAAVTRNRIARLNADGTLDTTFDPNADGNVLSIHVQSDGKVLIGGPFFTLSPNGGAAVTRNRIARLERDGRVDRTLDINMVGNNVFAAAIQPDGKILIGGLFTQVLGVARNNIARLNTDGTLDTAFDPNANGAVRAIAVQSDGKILIGGAFSGGNSLNGNVTRNYIARLETTGAVDAAFDPNANGTVFAIALQSDGKILIGGQFNGATALNGNVTRNRIARLETNGAVDAAFDPNANNFVYTIAVQSDGRILIGGAFSDATAINGNVTRNYIARLETTGVVDAAFDPNSNSIVYAIAVQADGKILFGGVFTTLNGNVTRNYIARLETTGAVDAAFDPNANGTVFAIALQSDGKILIGGQFNGATALNGNVTRNYFARLSNDTAALSALTVTKTTVTLTRNGSAAQFTRVVFEQSTDNGATYTTLGQATNSRPAPAGKSYGEAFAPDAPTAAGYTLTGLNLPTGQNILIRARGFYRTGYFGGSETIEDKVQNVFLAAGPTAAAVSISGRVITPQEFGLTGALVTLTDSQGNARTLLTGKFGTFHFTEVAAGETYILSVRSKRYTYAPQVITVTGDVTEVNFSPQ